MFDVVGVLCICVIGVGVVFSDSSVVCRGPSYGVIPECPVCLGLWECPGVFLGNVVFYGFGLGLGMCPGFCSWCQLL